MKTLYLPQRVPYPPNKGEKIRTFHQIKYLLENNHEIFFCCPYTSDDELDLSKQFADKYGVHASQHKLGLKAFRYFSGLVSNKALSVSNFYSRRLQECIDQLLAKEVFQNLQLHRLPLHVPGGIMRCRCYCFW